MLKARDMMTKVVVTVTPDTEITQAAKLLLENHFNGLPVVDDRGRLIGIICQDDLIVQQKRLPLPSLFTFFDGIIPLTSYRSMEKEVDKILASKVSQAMTLDPITIDPDTSLEDIATLMVNNTTTTSTRFRSWRAAASSASSARKTSCVPSCLQGARADRGITCHDFFLLFRLSDRVLYSRCSA